MQRFILLWPWWFLVVGHSTPKIGLVNLYSGPKTCIQTHHDSGEKIPRWFLRWFWDFLKEEKVFLSVFFNWKVLYCYSKCNLHFQSLLICWVLITENITKMPHTKQWFYWDSTFQWWILIEYLNASLLRSCSKIDPPFVTFLVTLHICWDKLWSVSSPEKFMSPSKSKEKILSIDRRLSGNWKKKAQVWANFAANSWRLMVSVLHWGVMFQIHYIIEENWWWGMITNGLKSPNNLYLEVKNQNMRRYGG